MGLKFESTISAKVFFGQDAAKQSDDSILLQIRMLEDELHRKKIQWSKLKHGNAKTIDDISESRLRKAKCAKVSVSLEEEFKEEQVRMKEVLTKSNAYSRDISYLETKEEEIMNRMETRGVEQKEEQEELMEKLAALREEIDRWDAVEQKENIERSVQLSVAAAAKMDEMSNPTSPRSPRSESSRRSEDDDAERET